MVYNNKVWFGAAIALLGTLTFMTSAFAVPQASQRDALPSQTQVRTALQPAMTTVASFSRNNADQPLGNRQFNDPIAAAYRRTLEDWSKVVTR